MDFFYRALQGFLRFLTGPDYLRLEVLMDLKSGHYSVRWRTVAPHPTLSYDHARISLAALHFGQVLGIADKETRERLFAVVSEGTSRAVEFHHILGFPQWGVATYRIWPWTPADGDIARPTVYCSNLKIDKAGDQWVVLKFPWGHEPILAPSSALLALATLSGELSEADLWLLLNVLLAMLNHYEVPERAAGGEAGRQAFKAAFPLFTVAGGRSSSAGPTEQTKQHAAEAVERGLGQPESQGDVVATPTGYLSLELSPAEEARFSAAVARVTDLFENPTPELAALRDKNTDELQLMYFREAIRDLEAAEASDPTDMIYPFMICVWGPVHARLYAPAVRAGQRAMAIAPADPRPCYSLLNTYWRLTFMKAAEQLDLGNVPAVGIFPDDLRKGLDELGIDADEAARRMAHLCVQLLRFNLSPQDRKTIYKEPVKDLQRRFRHLPEVATIPPERRGWQFW